MRQIVHCFAVGFVTDVEMECVRDISVYCNVYIYDGFSDEKCFMV